METTRNIEFAPQLTPMQLDVYRPAGAGKRTAVLLFHGGAWRIGSRSDLAPHAKALTERGFVVVAADYRLLPDSPWPSQVRDVRAAISWVRQHASELQVQDDRIVGFGYSAGAHLALLAAADPEGSRWDHLGRQALNAVIAVEPPVAFHAGAANEQHYSVAARLLGKGAAPDDIAAASPLTYVTKAFPPTCFFHGLEDKGVARI